MKREPVADENSVRYYVERMLRNVPETIDLALAENEQEFVIVFNKLLERGIMELEKNAGHFAVLPEEGLTAALKMYFIGTHGITVSQESHSRGHVDLTIEIGFASPVQRRLVETKIEKGAAYHVLGLKQLLQRYFTGRESTAWLILYVKQRPIEQRMLNLRSNLDKNRPCNQCEPCKDNSLRWSFASNHTHENSGSIVTVIHIGCNLFNDK